MPPLPPHEIRLSSLVANSFCMAKFSQKLQNYPITVKILCLQFTVYFFLTYKKNIQYSPMQSVGSPPLIITHSDHTLRISTIYVFIYNYYMHYLLTIYLLFIYRKIGIGRLQQLEIYSN